MFINSIELKRSSYIRHMFILVIIRAPIQSLPENFPQNFPELGNILGNIFGKILIQMDF